MVGVDGPAGPCMGRCMDWCMRWWCDGGGGLSPPNLNGTGQHYTAAELHQYFSQKLDVIYKTNVKQLSKTVRVVCYI